jgi:hypothetical protein
VNGHVELGTFTGGVSTPLISIFSPHFSHVASALIFCVNDCDTVARLSEAITIPSGTRNDTLSVIPV